MPPSKMSDEKLKEIIALVQDGANWSGIQRKTGIDRRTAKSAYQKWERSSSVEQLQGVRSRVAEMEFRAHIDLIVKLAESLISNIGMLPISIDGMRRDGEEFLTWFWEQDLLQRYSTSEPQFVNRTSDDRQSLCIGDPNIYLDEKKFLFQSLREHTQGEVHWNILDDDWKNARDKCAERVPQIQKTARDLIDNYLKNSTDRNFLEKLIKQSRTPDPAKTLTETIVDALWLSIARRELKEGSLPSFEVVMRAKSENVNTVAIRSGDIHLFSFIGEDNEKLAEKIQQVCNSAIVALSETNTVKELNTEVDNIIKASGYLRVKLNPLKLRPLILRTRCELCPV